MEEDGEIFDVDNDDNQHSDFSMSSYDGDGDILDIKPPQAQGAVAPRKEKKEKRRSSRKKGERSKGSHRSRSDTRGERRHRERESHRHRDSSHKSSERRPEKRHKDRSRSGRRENRSTSSHSTSHPSHPHSSHYPMEVEGGPPPLMGEYHYRPHQSYDHHHRPLLDPSIHLPHLHHQPYPPQHYDGHHHQPHRRSRESRPNPYPPARSPPPAPEMSPISKARRERMLNAEKERELSQRKLESRRQRKEREEEEVQPSPQRSPPPLAEGRGREAVAAETEVHVISENDEEEELQADREAEKTEDKSPAQKQDKKDSDSSSSDSSDSSSSSSSSSDSSDSDEGKTKQDEEKRSSASPGFSHVFGGRFDDLSPEEPRGVTPDADDEEPLEQSYRSPSLSPRSRLEASLPPYFPAISGCRSVDSFECLNRIAEGTYGVVYRAREKCNDRIVALKRLKMEKEKEGFPITSLREINTLLKGQHENIVTVREIVVGSSMDKIYIVMDYVEHDLKALMETMTKKKQAFSIGEVKTLMIQLLSAVHHLHDNWILHRDLKTSNLLLSHKGVLKVGDFGLAREYGSPLKQYTPIVVTLWYRAPELLLGAKKYSTAIDVWSVGCIFGELLGMEAMFPGRSEVDQLNRIFKELGTPSDTLWPGYSSLPIVKKTQFVDYPFNKLRDRYKERLTDLGFNLINKLLTYNPERRISCLDALRHKHLTSEAPTAVPPALFPTWPARSERPAHGTEPPAPAKPLSPPRDFKELEQDASSGFTIGGGAQEGPPGFQIRF